jgi:hypothetical protein
MQQAIADWRTFTRRMKKEFPAVSFLRVPERHKSGAVHFHAVLFGLPESLPCITKKMRNRYIHDCSAARMCERKLRHLASIWGLGFVDLNVVRKPQSIGAYISKYLTKGEPDWSLFGNHVASCNSVFYDELNKARTAGTYWELSSFSSPTGVEIAIDDILPRSSLRQSRTFITQWLGEARYDVYDIESG